MNAAAKDHQGQDHEPQPILIDNTDRLQGTQLRRYFEAAVRHQASDVHMKPKTSAKLRIRGRLRSLEGEMPEPEQFEREIQKFLTAEQMDHYAHHGAIDMAYEFDDDNRFRVNIFRTRGHSALAARRVSSQILNYEQLRLPHSLEQIAEAQQGLVLVCGITGSGKSTTIASMLQQINMIRACHILTIEDPIEFIFKDGKATVNQREVGVDVPTFHDGLRSLVREDPDVVLIGEMRDRDTFQAALQAAETGHLVFGTIHASSATQVFSRIYNLFPSEERDLIRDMLSYTLKAVVYQKLLESILEDVHRVPAVEILMNNPVVAKYIMDEREPELGDVIRSHRNDGMMDLTSSLVDLVQKEYIHPKVAMSAAHNPDELKMRLKGISTVSGG